MTCTELSVLHEGLCRIKHSWTFRKLLGSKEWHTPTMRYSFQRTGKNLLVFQLCLLLNLCVFQKPGLFFSESKALNIWEIGLAARCIIYIRAGMRTDTVRKMKRSGSSHKPHNLKANSGCRGKHEHLDLHNIHFFSQNQSLQHLVPWEFKGNQVWYDNSTNQLAAHMPHARPLYGERNAAGGEECWPTVHYTQPTSTCVETAVSTFFSLTSFTSFFMFLPCSSVFISFVLTFELKLQTPITPKPQIQCKSSGKRPAGQIWSGQKYKNIKGKWCLYQLSCC